MIGVVVLQIYLSNSKPICAKICSKSWKIRCYTQLKYSFIKQNIQLHTIYFTNKTIFHTIFSVHNVTKSIPFHFVIA